jgi:hypothetical protein
MGNFLKSGYQLFIKHLQYRLLGDNCLFCTVKENVKHVWTEKQAVNGKAVPAFAIRTWGKWKYSSTNY